MAYYARGEDILLSDAAPSVNCYCPTLVMGACVNDYGRRAALAHPSCPAKLCQTCHSRGRLTLTSTMTLSSPRSFPAVHAQAGGEHGWKCRRPLPWIEPSN
eukprot:2652077-Amphidinium_carterae.1